MNIKKIIGFLAGGLAAVLLIGVFVFSSLYKVDRIEVMGTSRYSEEEIKKMVLHGIAAENTILACRFLSRDNVTDVPFVDAIRITALDRNTIAISVHEKKAVGCFPYLDCYIYFDRNGVFIESERNRDVSIPYFSAISVDDVVQNKKLEIKGTTVLDTAVVLSTIFQKNKFMPDDISFDENYQITLQYEGINVALGKEENLEEKMTRVLAILPKISGRRGTLHAETVNKNSKMITFELEVTSQTWDGGYEADGEFTGEGEYNASGEYVGPKPAESAEGDKGNTGQKTDASNIWNIDLTYLDADGDGINDYTGDSVTEDSLTNLSYLDEDGDGINDYTGEAMPGTENKEKNEDGSEKNGEGSGENGSGESSSGNGSGENSSGNSSGDGYDEYEEYYDEYEDYENYDESSYYDEYGEEW